MLWQEKILNRISEDSSRPQIVIDETSILLSDNFQDFLKAKSISYCICNTENEVLKSEKIPYSLIICTVINIPTYLENKYEIIRFTWKMLPLHIEKELCNKITTLQLILLLDYFSESQDTIYLNQVNIDKIILEANNFFEKRNKTEIENQIKSFLEEEISINLILKYGKVWGDYLYSCYKLDEEPDSNLMSEIDENVFSFILSDNLKNIYYRLVSENISVDKILPHLKSKNLNKIALLCFDGMGWAEWKMLEFYLTSKGFQFSISPQFALIPTITVISRTAIFSGSYSSGFESSPNEKKTFENYWSGSESESVFYSKDKLDNKEQLVGINYFGMIYSFFDKLAHGLTFPKATGSKKIYFDTINSYLNKAKLENDISILLSEGFKIFFCSDHGSVLSKGNGKKIDKYLIDKTSRRATIVEKSILNKFINEHKYNIPFIDNKIAVIAKNRELFAQKNKIALSHGGLTVEELIVPFVEVI